MIYAKLRIVKYLFVLCTFSTAVAQEFASYFNNCQLGTDNFDHCLRTALNDIRPFFKTGLPKYGIESFDPFFQKLVVLKRGSPSMNFVLSLKDVYESGWTFSKITNLKTDFKNNKMQYSQTFPDKYLNGHYELVGNILGNKINNSGLWNLTLNDYVQTTTITRIPRKTENGTLVYDTPIKVSIKYDTTRDMKLYISNLVRGRELLSNMVNNIINSSWRIGILFVRPFIDELVSTAFTDIFTRNLQYFPFNEIIH
ncbi:hypothetical protein RN001_007504 [Aquatica leii]|uniref:Circadian clock-controlled protein n=1 Tax=Aquatica leii TaxID=1421715 RepID=A0AAN7SNW6_9COLE|nr:hypothetical protein RN001_007504 [Aquatica leii]